MVKISKEAALAYHAEGRPGKIEVKPTKPYRTQNDLGLAYSPGVAYPCLEIQKNPEDVYKYTDKGNLVAVITNGTAVLGLGDIGAMSGKPVMEGKGLLFKIYGGIDVFDIEINEKDPEKFCDTVERIAPTFGGINLEDIKAPQCFYIEERLKKTLDIPVMHDDQHGTAIISAAGLKNALEVAGKKIDKVKIVVNGAGAAAISCTKLYVALGARKENIVMLDSKGVITSDRTNLTEQKKLFATDRRDVHTLAEAIKDADVFVGLSKGNVLTQDMVRSMAKNPIVFALANPVPEISYEDATASRPDVLMSTGRSDYPNQINNVIGFPYIFRGALDVHATAINEEMKLAAVNAIANLAKQPVPDIVNDVYHVVDLTFGRKYFIPKPIDPRLITEVSAAVAKAAIDSGVARKTITDWDAYKEKLKQLVGQETKLTQTLHATARLHPQRVVFAEGGHPTTMKAAVQAKQEGFCQPILLGNQDRLKRIASRLKLDLTGIEIVDMRADKEQGRRATYAKHLAEKRARQGYTFEEAYDKMYERNYFGMSMVEQGDADAFITGLYTKYSNTIKVAKEVIGVRQPYKTFGTMHILSTKKGKFYIADTLINRHPDENVLADIARLSAHTVQFFNDQPVIAMLSYSNFGTDSIGSPVKVHSAVKEMQTEYPDLAIDGEMQLNFALNNKLRDEKFPFSKLKGENRQYACVPESEQLQLQLQTPAGTGSGHGNYRPDPDGTEQAYPLY
jgi:malate dehydrogenase (oxaloacetate-decarboxylating)(NADP+)